MPTALQKCPCATLTTLLSVVLAGYAAHAADAAANAGTRRSVTAFTRTGGGYAMLVNNDLQETSVDINVDRKTIRVHPTNDSGAFPIPAGGSFPVYLPPGAYRVTWGGPRSTTAVVNPGRTTTVAFEPFGSDNTGMKVLVNDGSRSTGTVLFESNAQRLAELAAMAPSSPPAVDAAPTVVVQDDTLPVAYASSPVVGVDDDDIPYIPGVTFGAGFVSGDIEDGLFWDRFSPWSPYYNYPARLYPYPRHRMMDERVVDWRMSPRPVPFARDGGAPFFRTPVRHSVVTPPVHAFGHGGFDGGHHFGGMYFYGAHAGGHGGGGHGGRR